MSNIESVYLAARYGWKAKMCEVADTLEAAGVKVTSRWIRGYCDGTSEEFAALIDLEDLNRADALVLFSDKSRGVGRHIEFG